MDPFSFQDEPLHEDLLWSLSPELFELTPAPAPPVVSSIAFVPYIRSEGARMPVYSPHGTINIHRRVIGLLRSIPMPEPECAHSTESRGFRHMMRERQRREKLSQSYADLYSMLSPGSKADKNSIVQSAAVHVRELKGVQEKLRQQNGELRARSAGVIDGREEEKVGIHLANSPSAIDSMITALRCLKSMGVQATSIHSKLSDHELTAIVNVGTNTAPAACLERAVERAVKGVLTEMGENFPGQFEAAGGPTSAKTRSNYPPICHYH